MAAPAQVGPARQVGPGRRGPSRLSSAGPVALALAGWTFCFLGNWRGTDWAAQVYRASQASHWGWSTWDPGWYGGMYPLNYSLIYPFAAGHLGLWLVAAVSVAGAAYCFDRLVGFEFGARPAGSWYFAAATIIEVAIGQLPTLAAEALALGSVLCLASGRRMSDPPPGLRTVATAAGLVLGVGAALVSPVAGAFLAMALVAWGIADIGRAATRSVMVELVAGVVVLLSTAALPLLFPAPGYFPFEFGDLVVVLAICALLASPPLRVSRPVRVAAVLYGAVSIFLFVTPTPVGGNDARLAAYIGVPLVVCYLPRFLKEVAARSAETGRSTARFGLRAPLAPGVFLFAPIAIVLVAWQWAPIVEAFDGSANGPSSTATYYKSLIGELDVLTGGKPVRVEIPPTVHHWESTYVAPVFPLARGWERQLDVAYNPLFYDAGPLRASAYRSWLMANGVSYVALPDAPLDYAAQAEAGLLRSDTVEGLETVWRTAHWQLWRVADSPGLASGPTRVRSLTPRAVTVETWRPGRSLLRLRWSPYWSVQAPGANQSCVSRGPGGWTELTSAVAGELHLTLSIVHAGHGHCPPVGGVRS
jgi:hypothetical protein